MDCWRAGTAPGPAPTPVGRTDRRHTGHNARARTQRRLAFRVVNLSGLIYATIVVLWAAVLVPMWLRRHDDVTESRSVDRFQGAMRTLSRRAPAGDQREVLVPRRGQTHAVPDGGLEPPTAATIAAARRRRASIVLLSLSLVIGGLVVAHLVPKWAPVIPLLILAAFLLRARASARKVYARELTERRARAAEARRVRLSLIHI